MALTQVETGGIKNDAVTADKIPANAVGSSEIADDAVGSAQIADDAVVAAAIADDAVVAAAIADDAVVAAAIADNAVVAAAIADDAVGAAQLADDAVVQAAIADDAVNEARLQISNAGSDGQFLSRQAGNSGGLTWATVTVPAAYDDTKLKRDLNILALHTAIDNNKTAHSLENTFIEQFEDSSKITLTNAGRSTANEFIATINPNLTKISEGIAGGNNMLGNADQADASSYTGYDGVTRSKGQMVSGFDNYEAYNLKYIFPAGVDFEVIVSVRGTFQSVGYLHGTITDLAALDYKSSGSSWGNSDAPGDTFDSYPGTYYGRYHAPFNGDGANDWRNLYRWSRVSNNFTLQWLGRNTTDITVDATNIAALRTSSVAASGDVESIGADTTLASAMVIGFGEAGADSNRFMKIEVANTGTELTNATGTCESAAITAADARTKVSGVILYKDAVGTATLGTDLKVSFSCDNGSNYTALDSTAGNYTAGADFSTGIKTAYVKEVTCTSGTQIKYKVEWANQADGTKETQLHSIALNY